MNRYLLHMPHQIEALQERFEEAHQEKAQRLLAIPEALFQQFIPERFPLEPSTYLIQHCPKCGIKDPQWARLADCRQAKPWASSIFDDMQPEFWERAEREEPARLECIHCKTRFPNEEFRETETEIVGDQVYPYFPTSEGKRYYFTACAEHHRMRILGYRDVFYPLCVAYLCTGDEVYAAKVVTLLSLFADRFSRWPYLSYRRRDLPTHHRSGIHAITREELGQSYGGWFIGWGGSYMVTEWGLGYDLIRNSKAATPAVFAWVRDHVIKPVLEAQVYPIHHYFLDKFHNSTTNHYRAIASAAHVFGEGLVIEDIVSHTFRLEGGDIAQELLWGAKGIRQYIQNCFDATGLYAERTSGYQEYAARGILSTLAYLRHYSDPTSYTPGPDIASVYRPITDFRIEHDLPQAARALHAMFDFQHSDGEFYVLGDSQHKQLTIRDLHDMAQRCPDRRLLAWEKALGQGGEPASRSGQGEAADASFPPVHDVLSQDFGLAILRSNRQGAPTLGISWTPHSDYHSHYDSLRITYRAFGETLFPDLLTNYASPFRNLWVDRTLAHSTVTTNGKRQRESTGGALRMFQTGVLGTFLAVEDSSVYPDLTLYKRRLVNIGGETPYVVDLFSCAGGTEYTQSWVGSGAATFSRSLNVAEGQPRKAVPAYDDDIWWEQRTNKFDERNGEHVLTNARELEVSDACSGDFTWPFDAAKGELVLALQKHDKITVSDYPFNIVTTPPKQAQLLLLNRSAERDEPTHFLAAYRVTEGSDAFAMDRTPVQGGIQAKVTTGQTCDVLFFRTEDEPIHCGEMALHFDGELLILRYRDDELVAIQAAGGSRLTLGKQIWAVQKPSVEFTVTAINIGENTIDIRMDDGGAELLAGRMLFIRHLSGHQSAMPVLRTEALGDGDFRVWLDPEQCKLYTHSGLIDENSQEDMLSTPTMGPELILPDAHVYVQGAWIGRTEDAACTGEPLKVTGTTPNEVPRRLNISIREGTIPPHLHGREFYISHFARNDRGHAHAVLDWTQETRDSKR